MTSQKYIRKQPKFDTNLSCMTKMWQACFMLKYFPIGFRQNSFSANMQQICRRTLMGKCDFSKVGWQLYWTHIFAWVFSCLFPAYLQNKFFEAPETCNVPRRLHCSWICNVIKLVKMILKSLWYLAHLIYPLLPKLFFTNDGIT